MEDLESIYLFGMALIGALTLIVAILIVKDIHEIKG